MGSKIHIGDEVIVLTGKDKGKNGKIISFISKDRVIIKGINFIKKHKKENNNINKIGEILKKEAGIHKSNVAIFNSESNIRDNVDYIFYKDKKIRIFRSNKKIIK